MPEFVTLKTPLGEIYVNREAVTAIGYAHVDDYWTKTQQWPEPNRPVRLITVHGGAQYYIYDDAVNMGALLSEVAVA